MPVAFPVKKLLASTVLFSNIHDRYDFEIIQYCLNLRGHFWWSALVKLPPNPQ